MYSPGTAVGKVGAGLAGGGGAWGGWSFSSVSGSLSPGAGWPCVGHGQPSCGAEGGL